MWCVTTVNEKWKGRARNDLYWLRCGFSQHNWSISWREISHKTKMIIWNMWRWNITHQKNIPVANFVLCQHTNLQNYKITKDKKLTKYLVRVDSASAISSNHLLSSFLLQYSSWLAQFDNSFLPPCCAFFLWDNISFGVWKAFHWKVKPVMEGCRPGPAKTF